jgi:hypothetical protein
MFVLLALLAFGGFILGFVSLVKPLPKLWIATHRRGGQLIVGSLLAIGVAGAGMPSAPAPAQSAAAAQQAAKAACDANPRV